MDKCGCTYNMKSKITAIFLIFAFFLSEVSFSATDIPASEKLSPPSSIKPIEALHRRIKDQITFNMKDRGVVKRGIGEDQRKWAFWEIVEEQSEIYRLSSGDLRGKLHELVDNSYDSIVDRMEEIEARPENFVAEITIEAILGSEYMTLSVTDNGKPITFKPDGTPIPRYRDPKKHFGGVNFGTKYVRAGLDSPERDIRWISLDTGTQVVVTIPKKHLPGDFLTRAERRIFPEGMHEFANSYTVAVICRAIEKYVSLDDQETINNIYTWATSSPNTDVRITPGAHEVIIDIPGEGLAVRYFDPTQANLITPYSDMSGFSTRVVGSRLHRQVIRRTKSLKGPDSAFGDVEVDAFESELKSIAKKIGLERFLDKDTKFALHIGDNLNIDDPNGSKTHEIFNVVFRELNKNVVYLPYEVPEGDFNKFKQILRLVAVSKKVIGFDTGAPFKLHITEVMRNLKIQRGDFLTGIDFVFKDIDGDISGGNWNGDAWVSWYESQNGKASISAKKAVILGGAGPTGTSIATSLLERGISTLCLQDMNVSQVEKVGGILKSKFQNADITWRGHGSSGLQKEIEEADIIINATGVGKKNPFQSPLTDDDHNAIRRGTHVIDLNYRPHPINAFLRKAQEKGAIVFNGTGLMVYVNAIHATRAMIASGWYPETALEGLRNRILREMGRYVEINGHDQGILDDTKKGIKYGEEALFGSTTIENIDHLLPELGEHMFPIHIIPEKDRYGDDGVPSLRQVIERVPPNERYLFPDVNADRTKFDEIRPIHKAIADAGFIDGEPNLEESVKRLVDQYPDIEDRVNEIMVSNVNKKGKKVNLINLLYERAGIKTVQYSLLQHARDEWRVVTALINGRDNFREAIVSQTLSPEEILRETNKHFFDEIRSLRGNRTALNFVAHFLFLHDLGKYVLSEEDHEIRSSEILETVFEREYFKFSPYEKKLMIRMVALHSAIDRINFDQKVGRDFSELAREAAADGFFLEQDLKDILRVVMLFRIAELASSGHFAFIYENTFPELAETYRTAERIIENEYSRNIGTVSRVAIIAPRSIRGHGETLLNAFEEVGSGLVEVSMEIPENGETISAFADRIRKSGYDLALVALHGAHDEEPVAFEDFGCDVVILPIRPGEVLLKAQKGIYDMDKWNAIFRKAQAVILLGKARIRDFGEWTDRDKIKAIPIGFSKIPDFPDRNKHFENGVVIGARTLWSEMRSMHDIRALVGEVRKYDTGEKAFGYIAGLFAEYEHPETKEVVNEFEDLRSSPDCLILKAREIERAYNKEGGFNDLASFKRWLFDRLQEKGAMVVIVEGDIENEELRMLETSIFDFSNEMYHEIMQGFSPKDEYSAAIHRNAGKSIPIGFDSGAMRDIAGEDIGIISVKYEDQGADFAGAAKEIIRYVTNPNEYYARLEGTWNAARKYTTKEMGQRYLNEVIKVLNNKDARQDTVKNYADFINRNKFLLQNILGDNKLEKVVRVPVEAIESVGIDNIRDFLATVQTAPNGYVELYYMTGIDEIPGNMYRKYGLEKKELPKGFKRTRENTITLFPAFKGEEIDRSIIGLRLGNVNISPEDTILSPIGLQNDPAGLIRATIFGLAMMDVVRSVKEPLWRLKTQKPKEYRDMMDRIQMALESYKSVSDPAESFEFTDREMEDVFGLISGDINSIVRSLNKLIKLLPITPINAEELRQIYEHTRAVMMAA
jgi:shikimate 5-dehydrogenase